MEKGNYDVDVKLRMEFNPKQFEVDKIKYNNSFSNILVI